MDSGARRPHLRRPERTEHYGSMPFDPALAEMQAADPSYTSVSFPAVQPFDLSGHPSGAHNRAPPKAVSGER
jgi:hypothetical protein